MRQFKKIKDSDFSHYYFCKNTVETQKMYSYLQSEFIPLIKQHFSQHYLLERRPARFLEYLDEHTKTHPLFLRFSIRKLYPSIASLAIATVLVNNYEELTLSKAPGDMSQQLHQHFDSEFTDRSCRKE